ncbi:hypothetical protein [Clostridium sp. CCUG 7971]|uniref:hypothetical protein n=1 Tax=Clostridium sp. CCUG 7971 TaxID=2811414 RepID=UPI001ABAA193|nr:hypothetical protein [Clostridium sp. CCUG 7971]MBO3444587.1 hypothetical protein [Clostridium sp. CCUG 7971]
MKELYDQDFINTLPEISGKWKAPLISYIAKEHNNYCKNLKNFIEQWYEKIEDKKKEDSYKRLRSQNDDELKAKINEFLVAEFCSSIGNIEFDPTIKDGKTPELLWFIDNKKALLDVVTLSPQEDVKKENHDIDILLNYLKNIESDKYNLIIHYDYISRGFKPKEIKLEIDRYLEKICDKSNYIEPLYIDKDYFRGEIDFIPRKSDDKRKVELGVSQPARMIEPVKSISKRIKGKLSKYKWDGPIFVAICSNSSFGCDWEDVAEVLYGKEIYDYNINTGETILKIDASGMVMPKSNGGILNTSLTGVLHCEIININDKPCLNVRYLKNPFSKYKVDINIPTYPKCDSEKIYFEWENN